MCERCVRKTISVNSQRFDLREYRMIWGRILKAELSPSKKKLFICFNESPFKMMKNGFCFILRAFLVLKIFKFLSWRFGHIVERLN